MLRNRPQPVSVLRRAQQSAADAEIVDAGADYRRRARRLRHRLRHDPVRLHQSLRTLNSGGQEIEPAAPISAAVAFAEMVEKSLDGPILRYTQRVKLLKSAERLGIERFEANLVIAAVLHRHRDLPA